ncbi:hypothetical protein RZE82_02980 [Mollicutes bacterium LVI A0039]|nr:hypothetical protein RZE82_02980 [Mollicutes bacterium LVI A0039]
MKVPVADSKDIDIFVRGFECKKYREMICKTYIEEDYDLAIAIINNWKLKRIEEKYILKTRMYDENSYSKKMIRVDEKCFINKIHLFQTYINLMDNQSKFEHNLEQLLNEPKFLKDTEELYSMVFDKWENLLEQDV